MTEINGIMIGDRILVRVGRHVLEVEVLEKRTNSLRVRSITSGREFLTSSVVENNGTATVTMAVDEEALEEETEATVEAPEAEETTEVEETTEETTTEQVQVPENTAVAEEAPRRKLSLMGAAVEVLKAERRPMNAKELVALAKERGLWQPTECKTPEQSLYGAMHLEIKNSPHPRVRKSGERGKFELVESAPCVQPPEGEAGAARH